MGVSLVLAVTWWTHVELQLRSPVVGSGGK
jgi:hypothetical protein